MTVSHQPISSVTVIIPARDEEATISQVVDSIDRQTVPPMEIIVADGGSTDRTREIVKELHAAGRRVRLIEDDNALPGRARNLAIRAARTEWVAMTDAGTEIPCDWLQALVREAEAKRDCDVVFGSYEPILDSFFRECLALAFVPNPAWIGGRPLRGPSTCSMMIRKSVWEQAGGFPEDLRACEDLLFFERLNAGSFVVRSAPDAIVGWNIPGDFAAAFARFRSYSHHTLKAGLWRTWHRAIARMYLIALFLIVLFAFVHPAFLLFVVIGLAARAWKNVRERRQSLPLKHRIGLHTYVVVALITMLIDLAAFVGAAGYLVSRVRRRDVRSGQAGSSMRLDIR